MDVFEMLKHRPGSREGRGQKREEEEGGGTAGLELGGQAGPWEGHRRV